MTFFAILFNCKGPRLDSADPPPSTAAGDQWSATETDHRPLTTDSFLVRKRKLLDLQELQLDRSRAPEDRDHHLQRALVGVDLLDHAREALEGPLHDSNRLALRERD